MESPPAAHACEVVEPDPEDEQLSDAEADVDVVGTDVSVVDAMAAPADFDPATYVPGEAPVGYELRSRYVLISYLRSSIEDVTVFERLFVARLKEVSPRVNATTADRVGFQYYGGQEFHEDGCPHYHVVVVWDDGVHMRNARERLMVLVGEGADRKPDSSAICFSPRRHGQDVALFVANTQAYCVKECGDRILGKRIEIHLGQNRLMRQAYEAAHAAPDAETAYAILVKADPKFVIACYNSVKSFLEYKRTVVPPYVWSPDFPVLPWRLPEDLSDWFLRNFDEHGGLRPPCGRYLGVVVISPPSFGKSQWALSFGNPVHMRGMWNITALRPEFTHLVVDDVQPDKFKYWKEVIGCQETFHASDKYRRVEQIAFHKPTIWLCNPEQSPLKHKAFRTYASGLGVPVITLRQPLFEATNLLSPPTSSSFSQGSGAQPRAPKRKRRCFVSRCHKSRRVDSVDID